MKLDALDVKILDLLQQDASLQVAQVAEQVGLSATACWRESSAIGVPGFPGTAMKYEPLNVLVLR